MRPYKGTEYITAVSGEEGRGRGPGPVLVKPLTRKDLRLAHLYDRWVRGQAPSTTFFKARGQPTTMGPVTNSPDGE